MENIRIGTVLIAQKNVIMTNGIASRIGNEYRVIGLTDDNHFMIINDYGHRHYFRISALSEYFAIKINQMSEFNLQELEALTIDWATEKGIARPDNAVKQALKMSEEAGEVCGAVLKGDTEAIRGEIGDVLVTLAILSHQSGLTLSECFKTAYTKISKRKGQTRDGVFIKESDLNTF